MHTQTIISGIFITITCLIIFVLAKDKYQGVRDIDSNRFLQLENIFLETDLKDNGVPPKQITKYIYLDQTLSKAIILFNNNYCYLDKHACMQINSLVGQFYHTFALTMNEMLNVDYALPQLQDFRKVILNTLHEYFVKSSTILEDANFPKIIRIYQSATYRAIRIVGRKFKKHVKPPYPVSEYVFLENFNLFV